MRRRTRAERGHWPGWAGHAAPLMVQRAESRSLEHTVPDRRLGAVLTAGWVMIGEASRVDQRHAVAHGRAAQLSFEPGRSRRPMR